MERHEAVKKLVTTWHLNTEERKVFESSPLTRSEVVCEIREILKINKNYPPEWENTHDYSGACLSVKAERIIGYKHAEIGNNHYSIVETKKFRTPESAISWFLRHMFEKEIDGIRIK